jgi:hypothetical protein
LLSALAIATAATSAASAAAASSVFNTATAAPLATVIVMIVFAVTAAVVVVVIVVVVPVPVVDNNVMPGPRPCRHCCPDVSSDATGGVSTTRWPLLPLSLRSLFPRLLPLTSRNGHDLLLRKSLF